MSKSPRPVSAVLKQIGNLCAKFYEVADDASRFEIIQDIWRIANFAMIDDQRRKRAVKTLKKENSSGNSETETRGVRAMVRAEDRDGRDSARPKPVRKVPRRRHRLPPSHL